MALVAAHRFIAGFLKLLGVFLSIIIVFAWLTGGRVFDLGWAKFELSSLDLWVIVLMAVLWLEHMLAAKGTAPPVGTETLYKKIIKFIEWLYCADRSHRVALVLVVFVFGGLLLAHVFRHLSFNTHAFDVTFVHQALFYPWAPTALTCDLCDGGSYFGEHLAFSFYLLAPFTWLIRDLPGHDLYIFCLQTLLLALPLLIALRFGPIRARAELWFAAVFVILCCRGYRNAVSWDFREDVLAFAFILTGLTLLYRGARGAVFLFCVCIGLALLSKENIAFVVPFLSAPILWDQSLWLVRRTRIWLAASIVVVSVAWGAVEFGWLLPAFSGPSEATHEIVARLREFGSTPYEVLMTVLTSPAAWKKLAGTYFLSFVALKYIVLLLAPFAYFIFKAPLWLIPALPGVMMNIISSSGEQRSLNFHYDLIILPFLIFGCLAGMARRASFGIKPCHLFIGLAIALASSGRWPLRQVQMFWPSWAQVQDSVFLSGLKKEGGVLAAPPGLLAQVSHLPKLRQLSAFSFSDTEVKRILLDRHNDQQKQWLDGSRYSGWNEGFSSPSGRYQIVFSK